MARTSLSAIEQRNTRMLEYMHDHSSVTVEELGAEDQAIEPEVMEE